jgi:capsular polysaccharide biosynthesis protein
MFKNEASWMHLFAVIMKRNELFVTVSILASIISFIFLNILFVFIRWEHNPQNY